MILLFSIFVCCLFLSSLYFDGFIFNPKRSFPQQLLIFLSISITITSFSYLYIFHKPHRDFIQEEAFYSLSAQELLFDFQSNEERGNKKYLNQVVQISGKVTLIDGFNGIILENSVYCISEDMKVSLGDNVIVKGRCAGYDDLFLQVTLDQCIFLE